jgi:hypothetical protein
LLEPDENQNGDNVGKCSVNEMNSQWIMG